MIENRAGQPDNAVWYPNIVSESGEQNNTSIEGVKFWCAQTQAQRCSRQFRANIEGKTISLVLGSTNVSKLKGIEDENNAYVVYNKKKYKVAYAEYDALQGRYSVALT